MDRSMIQKAIGGSSEAFEVLYRETHDKGYSVAYSVLKDSYEAEDILQEAYISMYQKIDTLKNPNGFESWFYRIVKNEALDFLRKQRPEVFSSFENSDTDDFNFEDTIVSDYAPFDPEENVDYEDTKRIMAEIVDSLPDMQKRCIQFRFQKDMKISEIASSLEIPESTVKSNLTYGKKKIEEEVKKLEKKGVRLYSVAPALLIPFLRWMYGNQVPATLTSAAASAAGTVVAETASIVTEATSAVEAAIGGSTATATTGATTGVATAAAKTGISALATKIIAGVCAVALVGGGAAFAAQRSDRSDSTDHTESTDVVIDGTEITDVSASDKPISATEDADGLIPMVSKHMTFYLPTEQVKGPVTGGEDGEIYGYTLNNGISIIADLVRHDLGAEEFSSTYECAQYYVDEVYYVDVPIETKDGLYYFSRSHERSHSTNIVTFIEGPSGRLVVTGACDTDDFEQLKEEIWGYILTATPYWEETATQEISDIKLQDHLDFSKSWGIDDLDPNIPLSLGYVVDFAFKEDGSFYWLSYRMHSEIDAGGYGNYVVNGNQITFTFSHKDGTTTSFIYSFDPSTFLLTQVSENGLLDGTIGTSYTLTNHEVFPTAEEVISLALQYGSSTTNSSTENMNDETEPADKASCEHIYEYKDGDVGTHLEACLYGRICSKCGYAEHTFRVHTWANGYCVECGVEHNHVSSTEYYQTGEDGVEYLVFECSECGLTTHTPVS